jgi:hypothetical protein
MVRDDGGYMTGRQLRETGMASPEDGMAALVFFPALPTANERRTGFDTAREAMCESFRLRGISTPPGGWCYAMLHPDEDWRNWVSPHLVPRAEAVLATADPGTVVSVFYAYRAAP